MTIDYRQITARIPEPLFLKFRDKYLRAKLNDTYTTQNRVIAELVDMYVTGKVKMPWEEKK